MPSNTLLLLFCLWPLCTCKPVGRMLSEVAKCCVEVDESA